MVRDRSFLDLDRRSLATVLATNVASFPPMTTAEAPVGRRRGGIRRHGQGWQARVSAGFDPSTGERIVLYETVPIPEARTKPARERAEREAYKEAQKVLTRLQAEADALKGRSHQVDRQGPAGTLDGTTRDRPDNPHDLPGADPALHRAEVWRCPARSVCPGGRRTAGAVLRASAAVPRAVRWATVHREARRAGQARLPRRWMLAACL